MPLPCLMRTSVALSLGLIASLAAAQSTTASPNPAASQALHTRALAATCANCHGTEGRAIPNSEVPGLAGMPAEYMLRQLKGFKTGERPATVMHQLTKGFSDTQLTQIANYFARQPR